MLIQKNKLDKSDKFIGIAAYISDLEKNSCSSDPHELLFFDIETTGLSADTSYLYLIGCMFLNENNEVELHQFFAEGIDEENLLIEEFDKLLSDHPHLVHFNGQTFDIPYIEKKRISLGLCPVPFEYRSFDIYKQLKRLKKPLKLSSMSQKSLEKYIGLYREDQYDGGELIDFYNRYIAIKKLEELRSRSTDTYQALSDSGLTQAGNQKSEELLASLLLHNYEDVQNMLEVSSLLWLPVLLEGGFTIADAEISGNSSKADRSLIIALNVGHALPEIYSGQSFSCCSDPEAPIRISMEKKTIISIPVKYSDYKRFYPDYKNYYYMPAEDNAVHKSIGEFLDKDLRQKCTASNCYTRHTSEAVPIPGILAKGSDFSFMIFRHEYNSKFGFTPLNELLNDPSKLEEYVLLAISNMN